MTRLCDLGRWRIFICSQTPTGIMNLGKLARRFQRVVPGACVIGSQNSLRSDKAVLHPQHAIGDVRVIQLLKREVGESTSVMTQVEADAVGIDEQPARVLGRDLCHGVMKREDRIGAALQLSSRQALHRAVPLLLRGSRHPPRDPRAHADSDDRSEGLNPRGSIVRLQPADHRVERSTEGRGPNDRQQCKASRRPSPEDEALHAATSAYWPGGVHG